MKLVAFIALFLVGCGKLLQPSFLYYIDRNGSSISDIVAFGEQIAISSQMAFEKVDLDKELKSSIVFEASGNSWIYRALSIGIPNRPQFMIRLLPQEIAVSISAPSGDDKIQSLAAEWERFFSAKDIEYRFEKR